MWCVIGILGYEVFMPGRWSVNSFLYSYVMIFVSIAAFTFWKVVKRTKFIKPGDADLVTGLEEIEEHESDYYALIAVESLEEEGIKGKVRSGLSWIL